MRERTNLGLAAILIVGFVLVSGCIYLNEPSSGLSALGKPTGTDGSQANANAEEYADAALGGVFEQGDKVDFLGVKGTISSGRLENGKVVGGPPFQINSETGAVLIYASTDASPHGFAELFHYPQRGSGEGEGDLYIKGELIVTIKFTSQGSFNAYIMIACEPDLHPDYSQSVLIKRYKNCS